MPKNKDVWTSPESEIAGEHPFRRLFLDAMVVEESDGLKRIFHAAKKCRGNPVVRAEMPWEGTGIAFGGTVLRRNDKITVRYKCWPPKTTGGPGLVESVDGIHFTRPNLGLVEWEGSKDNNIVGAHGSIIKIRKPKSPKEQWGFYGYGGKDGASVSFGETALRPDRDTKKTGLFSTSDVVYFFYDPYQDRYVSTYKTSNRRHRACGIAISKDGYDWHKPVEGAVFGADDLDPDPTQIYGMPVFPYQGVYIGLAWMYHARWMKWGVYDTPKKMYEAQEGTPCTIDTQIAWSWDLISWNRTPKREPFISLGEPGTWDCEMIGTARSPIVVGDKLYFYYGGYGTVHDTLDAKCGGGLATLRLDGFCSMRAGKDEGWLISRRELSRTPKVTINAVVRGDGYIRAEILDRWNNVIPGFSQNDCIPFTGDSVRHEMTWKSGQFPADLVDADKKIRFRIRNADLYSYLPADIDTRRDTGKIP